MGLVFCLCLVAIGADFQGAITAVDPEKGTVTFKQSTGFGKDTKYGDPVTLKVAKDLKIAKGKFDKDTKAFTAGDAIEGGLKAEQFAKIDSEKGVRVQITTDDDKDAKELKKDITQILIRGGKKGN
jgi:hypothetical protein